MTSEIEIENVLEFLRRKFHVRCLSFIVKQRKEKKCL